MHNNSTKSPLWMSKKRLFMADILISVLLLAFDQLSKYLALVCLKGKPSFSLIKGILELDYLENKGAAFGMLQGQKWPLLLIGIVLIIIIVYLLIKVPEQKKFLWFHLVASAIIAGGLGNMIDRLRMGYVIDFISFILIDYPVFNIADCYVVVASIGLCILLLFVYKEEDLNFFYAGTKRRNNRKSIDENE